MHDLFMIMKYINNGSASPTQDEQTEIPYGALWNDTSYGKNIINAYNQNKGWEPAFKGYYHPANLFTKPSNPTHGQGWIDTSKNNLLHAYDENTGTWIAASALQADSENEGVSGFDNFINIFPMIPAIQNAGVNSYLIPNETAGRMFDGDKYIHPSNVAYTKQSEVTVGYTDADLVEKESWVHVNPNRLNNCVKRLIKVNKTSANGNPYEVDINAFNTEFYGIDKVTKVGKLLRYNPSDYNQCDYTLTDTGIKLTPKAYAYDYLYTISYSFVSSTYPGSLARYSNVVGTQDEVYVGTYSKKPLMFLDGLYLEQDYYTYDSLEGTLRIVNDDITQRMDMVATIFTDISKDASNPYEYTINQANMNGVDAIVGPLTPNTQTFVKPMAFVSGIMGGTNSIVTPEEIIINGSEATINNIGPIAVGDSFKVMIVETDGMYLGAGTVDSSLAIKHASIVSGNEYIVFVDGLMMSPREFNLSEGQIKITGLVQGQQWVLLKVDPTQETALVFDAPIANFSMKIKDNNDISSYNNCDNAIVYVGQGILMDTTAIDKGAAPIKGVAGQVIKSKTILEDGTAVESYKVWNYKTYSWDTISDVPLINEINSLITYFYTKGSISIIDSSFAGQPLTYYAYTYNNSVDEPLLYSKRITNKTNLNMNVNFDHVFRPGVGALTTYINGLNLLSEENVSGNGKFMLPDLAAPSYIDYNGIDQTIQFTDPHPYDNGNLFYVVERPESHESVSCKRQILTASNKSPYYKNGYVSNIKLTPGVLNVYVNGVKIERNDFTIIDENTIIIHFDLIVDSKLAINTDTGVQELDCMQSDEILIEVRDDFRLKTMTIPVRYSGQYTFSVSDDGLPESLLNTKDYVKIYINGVIYDGEYTISRDAGVLILEDSELQSILGVDAMEQYFSLNPTAYLEYQREYGQYYPKKISDRITIEWR
jgi:hypothetical protein